MYRMAVLAMSLEAQIEGLDVNRTVSMCLVHDLAEAIVGDITPHCGVSDEEKFERESQLCVAPNDGLVAIGSESGRVHVVEISATPSPVKHLLTRDTRKLKKVTSIVWSADSKTFYSGHANGVVMAHFLDGIAIPRKYTLCSCTEVVKRLQAKSLHAQTAQFILQYKHLSWSPDLIHNTIASLAETAKKMEHERLREGLQAILNGESSSEGGDVKAFESSPENHMKIANQEGEKPKDDVRSVRQRRRVRSSSCDAKSSPTAAVRKRASFPRSLTDILQISVTKQTESDSRAVEMSRKDAGVTVGNAAKSLAELAISTPEQGTGTDHNQLNANNVGNGLTSSPSKVISCHDEENNMHVVDTQWVIGRISQLRLKDDEPSDNNSISTNTSATERSISKPSSPNNSIDTERCSQCNIHKSWVVASLLATVCQRIKINYTSSDSDSVPITRDSWKALLQFKLSSQRSEKSPCI
ncbi:unnamed protein product, partial [Nippostrongylus brasiliensis]|uniref:Hermansky-Pudlak syndrome 5 protein (inferred by orthology to a human protein) n=1 Tax=Nippostrongylus brasiliensis TaxID=27835 RepID=A0A0N4YQC4_NIPBR